MSPSHIPALARHTVLTPLDRMGRAEIVAQRLAEAIQTGLFAQGEQLPSEADLAGELGVSPVTLREALATLRERGLVRTRRGRGGGTFVAASPEQTAAQLRARLLTLSLDDLRDLGDLYLAVASMAAWLAAQRASRTDITRLADRLDALVAADDAGERLRAEARFHVEIAAISRSVRLTSEQMALQTQLAPLMRLALEDRAGTNQAHKPERAIFAAIEAGDAERSRALAQAHAADGHARLVAWHMRLSAASAVSDGDATPLTPAAALERIADLVENVLAGLGEVREVLVRQQTRAAREGRLLQRGDLGPVRDIVLRQLQEQRGLVSGAGPVFADGVLGDAPLWLDWWCTARDEPRFLVVSLDPSGPEFYDYESADWFAGPRASGEPAIAGPLVDFSGTDAHNLTVSIPVTSQEGAFLGVVGADVPLGQLEATVSPILRATHATAVLVNEEGRVLASTDPSRVPGTLARPGGHSLPGRPLPPSLDGFVAHRTDRLPWLLLTAAEPALAVDQPVQ
jgi:DNA-binding FadR family transcriptional regulator